MPIRIALATVSGFSTGWPSTSGAAPSAWKPSIFGACADLLEALPVRGDVPGVADRDAQPVDLAELLVDLERGGLLTLDPERVDRVDQRDRVAAGELADDLERLVEVAAQRDDARAVHQRLGELARGDLALRDDDRAADARPGGVGGERRGRVAGRRADDRLGAVAHGVATPRTSCRGP